jgi:hypothetical protein
MDGQLLIVGAAVAAAGAYLLRAAWRARSGCGSGCGKCATPAVEKPVPGRVRLL